MVEYSNMHADGGFGGISDNNKVRGIYAIGFKRLFDLVLVIATAPIVLILVLGVAAFVARDGSNPFYSQPRVGRNGRIFRCWKIRSMVPNADAVLEEVLRASPEARAEWDSTQKLKNDPRVTRIGRIIRKCSVDELPQLFNVFKGEMSLVGPRPMMPSQVSLYPGRAYFSMRPGITGFWQISGRNSTSFSTRAVHDTAYANQVSLGTDLRVLFSTVAVVVRGTGY